MTRRDQSIGEWVVAAAVLFVMTASPCAASRLYVSANLATGADDGSSWANAFRGTIGLQAALAEAQQNAAVDQIWVARGVYKPAGPGGPRGVSFALLNNVTLLRALFWQRIRAQSTHFRQRRP